MRSLRFAGVALALLAVLTASACGGSSAYPEASGPSVYTNNPAGIVLPTGLPPLPAPQPGISMPQLTGESFDLSSYDKATSAVYKIFFRDTVTQNSDFWWGTQNLSGKKAWTLSNTCWSAPKAWLLGGNYWNFEDDDMQSALWFTQDGQDGMALTFYTRFNILPGDHGTVNYWDGTTWQQVVDFTGATNPSYPGWDKYYFKLPKNTSGMAQLTNVDFHFTSDGSGTAFGFAVDSVAVYQTLLGVPQNLAASDGTSSGQIDLTWDHNNTGTLVPENYDIYKADDTGGSPGAYNLLTSVAYPVNSYTDFTGSGDTFWYKVVAVKNGWPDSADSNEDSGYGIGTWNLVNVTGSLGEQDGSNSSLAIINGNPAVTWRRSTSGGGVMYSRSSTAGGTVAADWSAPVFVDTGDTGLRGTSLQDVSGRPAVTYHDITAGELLFARSADSDGSDWNGPGSAGFILDSGGGTNDVGKESTLRITADGFPCVSYTDTTGMDIKFAISTQADGTNQLNWNKYVLYDGTTVQHPWMEIVSGNPAIGWSEPTGAGQVSYWRANASSPNFLADWDGSDYSVAVSGIFATYPALFVCNGQPGIAYLDGNSDISFQRCSTATGDGDLAWANGSNAFVDGSANNFDFCRANFLLSRPRIAYGDVVVQSVYLTTASNANGDFGATWSPELIDSSAGEPCQPILVDGHMAFTYRNYAGEDLMYAIYL